MSVLRTHSSFVAWDVNNMLGRHQCAQETAWEGANLSVVDIILGERHSIASEIGGTVEHGTRSLVNAARATRRAFPRVREIPDRSIVPNVSFVDGLDAQINGYTTTNNGKESMPNHYVLIASC